MLLQFRSQLPDKLDFANQISATAVTDLSLF